MNLASLSAFVLGNDRRRRIRVKQWLIAAVTYVGSSLVMVMGYHLGWITGTHLSAWLGCAALAQVFFYIAVRSGLSERWKDPAMTLIQILAALAFADWAFLIAGPGRAVALPAMLLVLIFGAFLLRWKKLAVLTVIALAGFGASLLMLHRLYWIKPGTTSPVDLQQDVLYFGSLVVFLPLAGVLAAQLSRLRSTLRTQRSALAVALADVQRLAEFDDLTGLANRRRATDYLKTQQSIAQRSNSGFSVALIDLDDFKRINDTLGHDAGDKTLRAFADVTLPLLRSADLMARWGGEEFLVVMPDTGKDDAYTVALRMLEQLYSLPISSGGAISFSAGIAYWRPGEPVTTTVARADRRMYAAKHAGRNRIHITD